MDKDISLFHAKIKKIQGMSLVYIFGSAVKNSQLVPHDIDVAVLHDSDISMKEKKLLKEQVTDIVEKIFKLEGNVIFVNEASPLLKCQVIKHGTLIFERHQGIDSSFRFRALTEYFEYKELQDFFYKRQVKAKYYGR